MRLRILEADPGSPAPGSEGTPDWSEQTRLVGMNKSEEQSEAAPECGSGS